MQIESMVHAFYPHKIMYQALSTFGTVSDKVGQGLAPVKILLTTFIISQQAFVCSAQTLQKCVNCVYLLVTPDTIHQSTNKEPPPRDRSLRTRLYVYPPDQCIMDHSSPTILWTTVTSQPHLLLQ